MRHARTPADRLAAAIPEQQGKWRFRNGLGVYDWWIEHPPEGWDYCLDVTRSRHRAAAGSMREVAPGYPKARQPFERAAVGFGADADALDACMTVLTTKDMDPEARRARLSELFTQARASYAGAIDEVELGLTAVD